MTICQDNEYADQFINILAAVKLYPVNRGKYIEAYIQQY